MAKRSGKIPAWLDGDAPADDAANFGYGKGEVFDLKATAQIFGMTRYAIQECVARGAPVIHKPRTKLEQWQIAAGDFAAWLVRDSLAQRDTDKGQYRDAKTRLMTAQLNRIEDENAKRRAELVTLDEAVMATREQAEIVRKHLNAVPAAVVAALAKLTPDDRRDASTLESVIEDSINAAMAAICNDGVDHAQAA